MNRAIFFVPLLAIAGCASTVPVTPASVATDVATIGTGLLGALQNSGLTVPAQATEAVADIIAVSDALEQGETMADAQPLVQRVESDLNTVVTSVGALPNLPAGVSGALTAAEVLLPVVEAAVDLTVPASAIPGGMTHCRRSSR